MRADDGVGEVPIELLQQPWTVLLDVERHGDERACVVEAYEADGVPVNADDECREQSVSKHEISRVLRELLDRLGVRLPVPDERVLGGLALALDDRRDGSP